MHLLFAFFKAICKATRRKLALAVFVALVAAAPAVKAYDPPPRFFPPAPQPIPRLQLPPEMAEQRLTLMPPVNSLMNDRWTEIEPKAEKPSLLTRFVLAILEGIADQLFGW